jgi:hypothetical protein
MASFLYRAPAGVAGSVTRVDDTTVETGILNSANAPTAFGAPVKIVSGQFQKIAASDTASVFYGVLARTAPSIAGDLGQSFTTGIPNVTTPQGIVRRGYVNAVCTIGTPARGGQVYMRVVAATGKAVGDFEATADGSNNVALTGVTWAVDGKDSSNVTEIRIA